jgi:hypothetical protein
MATPFKSESTLPFGMQLRVYVNSTDRNTRESAGEYRFCGRGKEKRVTRLEQRASTQPGKYPERSPPGPGVDYFRTMLLPKENFVPTVKRTVLRPPSSRFEKKL